MKYTLFLLIFVCFGSVSQTYLSNTDFLNQHFTSVPKVQSLWLNAETKKALGEIYHRQIHTLRVKYWKTDNTSAWIFNEIGKEKPITIGIVVKDNQINNVSILAFRESRGWEVKYPFFTNQFNGVSLSSKLELSQNIDGISGATLSVNAVTASARAALYLNGQIN